MLLIGKMILYIRHGPKQYNNGRAEEYSLDPGLTAEGKMLAEIQFREYLTIYGIPPIIYASPYLRARETAEIARSVVQEVTEQQVPVVIHRTLGEYLGHQRKRYQDSCFRPETWQHQPIPPETMDQFKVRVCEYMTTTTDGWYITHGIFIREISHHYGGKISRPHELHGIAVSDAAEVTEI